VPQLFWGVDGRTHRLGPDGLALCRTKIDNSRPPEARMVSGCSVCDLVRRDRDVVKRMGWPGGRLWPVLFAVLGVLLVVSLLR
jgi:hypothetical protein